MFIDVVGMTNVIIYFVVFGTAIVFNSVLETLVPHALATNRIELTGHILNRGLFLWTVLFGGVVAGALNSGFMLSTLLKQDEEDAYMTQEYLIHLLPSLWFWGISDAYRRFFNCYHKFWTPAFTYFFTIGIVHPITCYQCVEIQEMGAKGLALSGFITNFVTYLILRTIQHCNVRMKPASFCPTFKTCCNLCQYLYYGIPQLIMFWIDTW
jgi:Na+-driven multidrug efflux pump